MAALDLHGLIFVSSATGPMFEPDIECLVADISTYKAAMGITGVLLHHDGTFFHYIEGGSGVLSLAYERIQQSPLHTGVIELFNEPISQRLFETWHIGMTGRVSSASLKTRNERWKQEWERLRTVRLTPSRTKLEIRPKTESDGPPLSLILGFWSQNTRTPA